MLQAYCDRKIDDLRARTMIYGIQVLAPYACRNEQPLASRVATELPPAMQRLCTADTPVRESRVAATVSQPSAPETSVLTDAGRPRPAEPPLSTEPCTADTPVLNSRVAATDNSPARSAGNPPTNPSSPVGTAETNDTVTTISATTRAELARLGITLEQREELRQYLIQKDGAVNKSIIMPNGLVIPLELLR